MHLRGARGQPQPGGALCPAGRALLFHRGGQPAAGEGPPAGGGPDRPRNGLTPPIKPSGPGTFRAGTFFAFYRARTCAFFDGFRF